MVSGAVGISRSTSELGESRKIVFGKLKGEPNEALQTRVVKRRAAINKTAYEPESSNLLSQTLNTIQF
jgi:hypothetical protein